eukprot:CAMPEP_0115185348 /NCGR_PEP_ID=MMETSP0270-20121206/9426_1 /TAXON_ID=71861 /ORGANISM="Scrippsiella trochoidea, Strain CCMP3099" /LENGTH=419 /DNA_ID=CAMNT_0002598451 /DNA_START=77 /DNA_END=1333 /DNA_ORIENTATION=+
MSSFASLGWPFSGEVHDFEQCFTDVKLNDVQAMSKKGITVDDITMRYCPSRIPELWPHTKTSVGSMRLFRTWSKDWPDERRLDVWSTMVAHAKKNDIKFLVGTPITCNVESDEQDWDWTKEFLRLLGPAHVMGFAVGNELELLYTQGAHHDCVNSLWDEGRLWSTFTDRVAELDGLGFDQVPVTSVFTAGIVYSGDVHLPFRNVPGKALVNDFLSNAVEKYGYRYVFTFNIYPYFDPTLKIAPPKYTCESAIRIATCFEDGCLANKALVLARQKMYQLTANHTQRLWIGGLGGLSSPQAAALSTEMAQCKDFSSLDTLHLFYENFLKWDFSVGGVRDPDFAFYFTLRDALNFGKQEYFGLIASCNSPVCKIASAGFTSPVALRGSSMNGLRLTFIFSGLALLLIAICSILCAACRAKSS